MFGFSSFSKTPFSTLVSATVLLASASVTANATVVSSADKTAFSYPQISANATLTADALIEIYGIGNINSTGDLTVDYTRIRTNNASITGYALFDADGFSLAIASGAIFSNTSVTADAIRERLTTGSINADASVTALGGAVFETFVTCSGVALVTPATSVTYSVNGLIQTTATVTSLPYKLGEEWATVPDGGGVWTTSSEGTNIWTTQLPTDNTWLRQG